MGGVLGTGARFYTRHTNEHGFENEETQYYVQFSPAFFCDLGIYRQHRLPSILVGMALVRFIFVIFDIFIPRSCIFSIMPMQID